MGYWGAKKGFDATIVQEADRLGYHSLWAAEAWEAMRFRCCRMPPHSPRRSNWEQESFRCRQGHPQ